MYSVYQQISTSVVVPTRSAVVQLYNVRLAAIHLLVLTSALVVVLGSDGGGNGSVMIQVTLSDNPNFCSLNTIKPYP